VDFLRTLKKRRPKKHVTVRIGTEERPKPFGIRIRRKGRPHIAKGLSNSCVKGRQEKLSSGVSQC
jgi:hypothetical protein